MVSPPFLALCSTCWQILSGWECFLFVKDKAPFFPILKKWINFCLHYLISDLNQLPNPFHRCLVLRACIHLLMLTFNLVAVESALGGGSGCLLSLLYYSQQHQRHNSFVDKAGLFLSVSDHTLYYAFVWVHTVPCEPVSYAYNPLQKENDTWLRHQILSGARSSHKRLLPSVSVVGHFPFTWQIICVRGMSPCQLRTYEMAIKVLSLNCPLNRFGAERRSSGCTA